MTVQMTIDNFLGQFETGARPYLFYFIPKFPSGISVNNPEAQYLIKSTTLPSSTMDQITTPWQGFDYVIAGKRSYGDLSVSFNVDLNANIHAAFLQWHDLIFNPKTNKHAYPKQYLLDQGNLSLLGLDFQPIMTYTLHWCWPSDVSQIALDYGSTGDYATFDVTFKYSYFTWESRNKAFKS